MDGVQPLQPLVLFRQFWKKKEVFIRGLVHVLNLCLSKKEEGSVGERISSNLPISSSSSSLLESSSSLSLLDQSTSSTSALEQSLEEAESRIAGLLSVKDRLVTVQVCL